MKYMKGGAPALSEIGAEHICSCICLHDGGERRAQSSDDPPGVSQPGSRQPGVGQGRGVGEGRRGTPSWGFHPERGRAVMSDREVAGPF